MAFERTRQAQTGWAQKAIQRPTTNSQGSRVLIGGSHSQKKRQPESSKNHAVSADHMFGRAARESNVCGWGEPGNPSSLIPNP